jgi:hypothetical protein
MSWLYSRALVEAYLGDTFLDGEQSVPLSGNPTQQAYCAPDKMTDFSRLSRFGMTYKPLMESRGEELLMSYLEDFHAKTSAQQAKAQELMGSEAGCGEKWLASFVKYDPDTSSWKTHQCSLLGGLDEFSETWPQWGLMRDGECWEQRTLEQSIRGTEFGLLEQTWPTPTASQARSEGMILQMRKMVESGTTTLEEAEAMIGGSLTPKRMKKWPTPNARDWKDTSKSGNRKSPGLGVVAHWPTPRTKGMCGGAGSWNLLKKNTTIEEARLMGAGNGGQLNPTWVEWLMGWPLGWTDLKPLVTDKSHCVPQQHGDY